MSLHAAVTFTAVLCIGGVASAREAPVRQATFLRDKDGPVSPARDRQKRCSNEWRGLSLAERAAKGPAWPEFYSRCVKRLKRKN
jgi:hypothetical protein